MSQVRRSSMGPRRPLSKWLRASTAAAITVLAVLGAVLAASSPASADTIESSPASADAIGPPSWPASGLMFGASVTPAAGQTAAAAFAAEEALAGRALAIDRSYSRWDDPQPSGAVIDDSLHGRVPVVSVVAQRRDGSKVAWASIAAGDQDTTIRAQVDGLRDLGVPLILIFHHEPDVSPGYGSAADFVAAFRHFVAIVRAENATNIATGVVLTPLTFAAPAGWYPGDDVVDWIGTDAYNGGGCAPNLGPWRSLAQAAAPFYNWAAARGKPLMLAEWGSAEDPAQPGRKPAWLADASATLAAWPAIKAVSYFDRVGTCDWRLGTAATRTAFRNLAQSTLTNGTSTARLMTSISVGPTPLYETFGLNTSTAAQSPTGNGIASWTLDFGDGTNPESGTGQPGLVKHNYRAGHWTATLSVTGAAGGSARTTATLIAAPPPTVSQGTVYGIAAGEATVPAWVYTSALSGSYYIQWGPTTAYGNQTETLPLAALDYTQAVTVRLAGLDPSTRYYWRIVATTSAGTTTGPDRWFTSSTS